MDRPTPQRIRHLQHALLLLGLTTVAASTALGQTTTDPNLIVETLVGGLDAPTGMAFLAPGDLLVTEKDSGRVQRVIGGSVQATPALTLQVDPEGERGLLGLAINTQNPKRVFVYYTAPAAAGAPAVNRITRYEWNAASGTLQNPVVLVELPATPAVIHSGGGLALGLPGEGPPVGDGAYLYAVIGDLGRDNQLQNFPNAGPPDDSAVVLRLLQDGTPAPGNPFAPYCSQTTTQSCSSDANCPAGEQCRTQVARYWAYGVRNSFGLKVDPQTGLLWDTENGPSHYDEINALQAGTNSGWEKIMGPDARDANDVGDLFAMPGGASQYSDPEFSWQGTIGVTGLVFPHASALGPGYDQSLLVGDYVNGNLYAFPLDSARDRLDLSGTAQLTDLVADGDSERNLSRIGSGFGPIYGGITDLEMGPDGALYILSIGAAGASAGTIYRVADSASAVPLGGGRTLVAFALTLLIGAWIRLRPEDGELGMRSTRLWFR